MADPYRITEDWQEGYDAGYDTGYRAGIRHMELSGGRLPKQAPFEKTKPKRKLSAWNKFVKANSKKPRFRYKGGGKKGKLNLKSMAVAFRRTPAGKKKKK